MLYLLLALGSSAWFVLQTSQPASSSQVAEIGAMEEAWTVVVQPRSLRISVPVLAVCLGLAFLGFLTAVLLLLGVRTSSRLLFLPWLIFNVLVIVSLLASGLFLVIHFTLLLEERDYLSAALSSPVLLLGIFLIFIWVLVDQLFISLGQRKLLVRVASSFRGSRASLTSSRHRGGLDTPASCRSLHSLPRKSRSAPRSAPSRRRLKEDGYRVKEFSCRLELPGSRGGRSRSLEHILGSSSSEESSVYSRQQCVASLPRLRKSREQPGMWRGDQEFLEGNQEFQEGNQEFQEGNQEFQERGAVTERLPRRGGRGKDVTEKEYGTLRSLRSLGSMKSVTIHPEVTEYHYGGRVLEQGAYHNPLPEEELEQEQEVVEEQVQGQGEEQVPAPVYPSLDWRERRRGLTRDQIIGYYCQPGDAVL